ncbi:PIN domain-containing protein [uncultured Acidaminococcus sp.]|uniref:PIN domain-containing protein n=1 Tax=uncultured Acidaminococcus sp. TaxID=352152 RepID=UPI0026651C48|nr:PIN domain-containing protein [uncultured Acidaminococcus sp.]
MQKVMIDTNIFISAALFPNGQVAAALMKVLLPPYEPIVCDYVIDELHRKFNENFPNKAETLESFLTQALKLIKVVKTPKEAMAGDKDFLEASITDPIPTTADQDVLGLAYTYGKDAFEEQKMEQARAVHRIAASFLSSLRFCYNGLKTEGGMQNVGGWNESTGFYIAGSGWSAPFLIRVPG